MTEKKTHYKCGACGEFGHNARTCPTKSVTKDAPPVESESPPTEKTPKKAPKKPEPAQIPIDPSIDLTAATRKPIPRPATAGKFRCPRCSQVNTLVLVSLPPDANGKQEKDLRCEACRNTTEIYEILIWGAAPGDAP